MMFWPAVMAFSLAVLAARAGETPAEAVLSGVVTDAGTGRPVACTVRITDSRGGVVTESAHFREGFRCGGSFRKTLPPGRTRVRVTRGFETARAEREVLLTAGQETQLVFALQRRVDLRARGWYAADSHVHMVHGERALPVDLDFVALTARAEDLHGLTLCQDWSLPDTSPEALTRELDRRSTPDCRLAWGMEMPKNYYRGDAGRCIGHCWLLSARGRTEDGRDVIALLSDASAADYESGKPSFANFESHRLIRDQDGAVFYSHPLRWWMGPWGGQGGYPRVERMRVSNLAVELPLDTVIGPTYDGLDVLTTAGEQEANTKAFALWALLLNHGYRLAATASSDACFDRPGGAVPGAARTYTFLPDGFTWDGLARATAAGRTFVTTGPLLLASLDGEPPGTVRPADGQPRTLRIEAWAAGQETDGLRAVEILRNGVVAQQIDLKPAAVYVQTNLVLREMETAWYCARATGDSAGRRASTGAFFFDRTPHVPRAPASAQVRVRVVDASSGAPLPATLTEIAYRATLPQPGRQHRTEGGAAVVTIPATVRLRAGAPGYASLVLSPLFDFAPLREAVTRLEAGDLLDWRTFERMRSLLEEVELTFALKKN